jgi:hypothetical protein
LPLKEVFSGNHQPFTSPLVGHALGGYYSYVPLEFEKSIKIVVRAKEFHFYEINYVIYDAGVQAHTYRPVDSFQFPSVHVEEIALTSQHLLRAGDTVTLLDSKKPGRIQELRLGPADAFTGNARDIVLRMYWDGASRPAVDVPVGDFFGYSFGRPATHSLLIGTEGEKDYVRFPMPFDHAARIELVSERSGGDPILIQSELVLSSKGKTAEEGTFHATWRRENPTTTGKPFTYLDAVGRGQMVGAILQAQGKEPGQTYFFEGDEEATIDGEIAFHGTGSETSFNGGWYDIPDRWYGRESLPLSGSLGYDKPVSRTGGYRLYIGDAYSFRQQLKFTIEHGGEGNSDPTDYVGTTFYYLDKPDGGPQRLLNRGARAVTDPDTFLLMFQPSPPPIAALMDASVEEKFARIGTEMTFFMRFSRAAATALGAVPAGPERDFLANHGLLEEETDFDGRWGPPIVALSLDVARVGDYRISCEGLTGPDGAILQMRLNDEALGERVDFYSRVRARSGPRTLGQVHLNPGTNTLYFSLPGRNKQSRGAGVDLISIQGTRVQ